jgi:glucose-6-phosphate-specific signal transduction histidine kinase
MGDKGTALLSSSDETLSRRGIEGINKRTVPLSQMWSKVKSILRKLKPRTFDELMETLKQALNSVTFDDISGWFKNQGYILHN